MTADQPESDWADALLPEQKDAASHVPTNGRLLAGPGTGKTLTLRARVAFLILKQGLDPKDITALTFTRAAAAELRQRVDKALEGKVAGRPRIATLHSFALKVLLRNADLLDALPKPLRIADDWEERNIIQEDVGELLDAKISEVQAHLRALSADWDTLRADDEQPNPLQADPRFVGAWQEHRKLYGYTLRSELVYQLKRAIEQRDDLDFSGEIKQLLVDEYQDLNRCDLAVIESLARRGAVVFAAGDDDQSIYGFRHANPEGIRRFDKDYDPSKDLPLKTCMRCDKAVMELARFVANLDPKRLQKPWEPRPGAGDGQVSLIRFPDGDEEAQGVASLCKYLIADQKLKPDDILILIRSDKNGAFSKPLATQMAVAGVPFHLDIGSSSPLDSEAGRAVLSLIRLLADKNDSLAWRTLLKVRKNGLGPKVVGEIEQLARSQGQSFAGAMLALAKQKDGALKKEVGLLEDVLGKLVALVGKVDEELEPEKLQAKLVEVGKVVGEFVGAEASAAIEHIKAASLEGDALSIKEVLGVIALAGVTPEQELEPGAVNMLTMHKAKGLGAKAVIIIACEDEYLPGRQQSIESEADERRLLYVSLTRARQQLFITYAQGRGGQQQHTGRDSGKIKRTLTRYLRNAPLRAVPSTEFFGNLGKP
jgi:ATP-dependent DNA helicase UvrD/PcrA